MITAGDVDVAVVGAGPAGAVAALVLARAGRRTLLLGGGPSPRRKIGEALVGAARPLLRDLGLLALVDGGAHRPSYGNVASWGAGELVATDFIRDPNGPGWHLDRTRLEADLRQAARDGGARWQPAMVRAVSRADDGWQLTVAGAGVRARWLVDATGRGATVARRLGAARLRDDDLRAVYVWTRPAAADVDSRTLVEAVPEGWWYSARLPDGTRTVAFHTDAPGAALVQEPAAWEGLVARTTFVRQTLAGAGMMTAPRATEACGARLDRFGAPGWLAAGDAALSFDPLSSLGLFNSLYTGMRAGQAVDAALGGAAEAVDRYGARLETIRARYLDERRRAYAAEGRWPNAPFWRSRVTSAP